MREIKFRAWSNDVNDMFFKGDNYGTTHDTDCITYARSQDIILMQFTGLTDKNGVEWFEDDIITYKDPEGNSTAQIIKGKFGWCKRYAEGLIVPLDEFDLEWFIHIGNIHQHPDLLLANDR